MENHLPSNNQITILENLINKLTTLADNLTKNNNIYKFSYENEKYVDECYYNDDLIHDMRLVMLLISIISEKNSEDKIEYDDSVYTSIEDVDDEDYEYFKQEIDFKLFKEAFYIECENYWKRIPKILKEIYALTHFSDPSITKKEKYERFARSIYILNHKHQKLSFKSFFEHIDFSNLFIKDERFIYVKDTLSVDTSLKNLMFYYHEDNDEKFNQYLQMHIYLLYYKEYLGLSYNNIPVIFNVENGKRSEKKKYLDRIDFIIKQAKFKFPSA
jgi:hypothetical protein